MEEGQTQFMDFNSKADLTPIFNNYSRISALSLQKLCLENICDKLHNICVQVTSKMPDTPYPDVFPAKFTILRFPSNETYFYCGLAEKMLTMLSEKKLINDVVMTLFDSRVTHLKSVKIKDAAELGIPGLKSLRGHKIVDLEVRGLTKATVTDLIGCLNDWTLQNLRSLNVTKSTFVDHNKYTIVVGLSKLRGLTSLNVSGTEFNKASLEMVVDDLISLESLDISESKVTDIGCLRKCRSRLKYLSMYNLKLSPQSAEAATEALSLLHELRYLDISIANPHQSDPFLEKIRINELLSVPNVMPHLKSIDISGKTDVNIEILKTFITSHSSLRFLGLVFTEACKNDYFKNASSALNLKVTGSCDEDQILAALRTYSHREYYVQYILYNLFRITHGQTEPRLDFINLVVKAAKANPGAYNVQMATSACLYNLCKGELGDQIHPRILQEIIAVDLEAMERFPRNQQLNKNVLLTICSDRMLQDVNFDRFRCAKKVLECLYTWGNHSINRMCVAIVSILAAKISTKETSVLGSTPSYMQKLLKLVKKRILDMNIDVTLKFTLSALWNLTDESPGTCSVFLSEGGLELYLKVLEAFPEEVPIQTKVLGLLNNIAEVTSLREHLVVDGFIVVLSKLIYSEKIEVSYFACGILAYLASTGGSDDWSVTSLTKEKVLLELFDVVMLWDPPEDEMVAYRSFKPFFPLLAAGQHFSVQLWALWAIYQVLSKSPDRYREMLEKTGVDRIQAITEDPSAHPSVQDLCEKILNILYGEAPESNK